MADITLLPSAKVPLVYEGENTMTTEWYRFFWNIYGFTGTGAIPVSKGGTGLNTIGDHQLIIGNANNVFEPALLSSASISITYPAGYVNLELGTSGVTPGTYGSASQVGVFTVNQYGVLTAAANTSIGINANQIISGTIASARISGSYTGITGVGTLTAGTWNAATIGVAYGGTGLTSFTSLGVVYASSTSALATSSAFVYNSGTDTLTAGTFSASTGAPGFSIPNQGTGPARLNLTNTGGTVYIGLDSSGGGLTVPYALNLYHTGAYPICFSTNNAEKMRIFSSGGVSIGNTTDPGAGNLRLNSTSNGIYFGSSSKLNDYQEGTYTPVVTTSVGSITSYTATGTYTKIGRMVYVTVNIQITNNGTGAGTFSLTLPFTSAVLSTGLVRETNLTGLAQQLIVNIGTTANILTLNNAYPAATGYGLVSGFCFSV